MIKSFGLTVFISAIILLIVWFATRNRKASQNSSVKTEPESKSMKIERQEKGYLKIYKTEVPNTKVSLIKKVDVSQFLEFVKDESKREYLRDKKQVYMWDFGVKATRYLNKNDTIWILTGNKLFETQLEFIINDPEGKIGDSIGWTRQFKSPWKNVAILNKCERHQSYPEWIYSYTKGEKNSLISNFYKVS